MTRDMKLTNSIPDLHFHHRTRLPETHSSPFLDPSFSVHDDFLDQILSTITPPSSSSPWELIHPSSLEIPTTSPDEITSSPPPQPPPPAKVAMMMLQQQLLMSMANADDDNSGQFQFCNDVVEDSSSFKCPNLIGDGLVPSLYNGFAGDSGPDLNQNQNQSQHFHHPQGNSTQIQNFGIPNAIGNSNPSQSNIPAGHGAGGSSPAQPRQRVRARRGQATDPHSIAERLRRERIAERMKALQELVPNANKTDKASMLDEIIDYVRFLQLQVKVLSMSRLGGAAAPMPSLLAADISSEGGGGDCVQSNGNSGAIGRTSNGAPTPSSTDTMTVAEHQVIKLLEEDMGSAMQYLQGKGLCLMPISLATAISTTTCRSRNPIVTPSNGGGEGPTSPSMSVLTVQSATATFGNGTVERGASASVSKP